MSTLAELLVRIDVDAAGVSRQVDQISGSIQRGFTGAADRVAAAGTRVQAFGGTVAKAGKSMTRNVTLPLLAIGGAAYKMASDFETSTTRIVALAGVPREQMNAWEGDVRRLARTFGKSGAEAADALFFIVSAGLEGEAAMSALEVALKASATGLGTVEEMALLSTSAILGYGSDVMDAARATDILAAAASEATFGPEEMGAALTKVIPLAAEMGVTFDEVSGIMAALAPSTDSAAEAATRINAMMRALLAPTQQAKQILSEVGEDALPSILRTLEEDGLLAAVRELEDTLDGDAEAMSRVLGSSEALQGALGLLGQDADAVDKILANTANSTGKLEDAWNEVSQTAAFELQRAIAENKDLLLDLGQTVLPIVLDIMLQVGEVVRGLAERWDGLSEGTKRFAVQAGLLVAALGPVMWIVGKVISFLGLLMRILAPVIKFIGLLVRALAPVVKVLGVVAKVIGVVVAALGIKIAIIAAVIAAVVALVVAIVRNWGKIQSFILRVLGAIGRAISNTWNAISTTVGRVVTNIRNFITNGFNQARTSVTNAVRRIKEGVTNGFNDALSFVRGIPAKILSALGNLGSLLYNAGRDIIQGLINGIGSMIGAIGNAIGNVASKIRGFLPFSPAEEGPLRLNPPDEAGRTIGEMLAGGLARSESAVVSAAEGIARAAALGDFPSLDVSPRGMSHVQQRSLLLEISGDGTARADFLVDELREAIRERGGGDPVAVLGSDR